MKKWVALVALSAFAGCQVALPEATTQDPAFTSSDEAANLCRVTLPPSTPWTAGDPFPPSVPNTAVAIVPSESGDWQAIFVDTATRNAIRLLTMAPASVPEFVLAGRLDQVILTIIPRIPPPPPPIMPPSHLLLAQAVDYAALSFEQTAGLTALVEADLESCVLLTPSL